MFSFGLSGTVDEIRIELKFPFIFLVEKLIKNKSGIDIYFIILELEYLSINYIFLRPLDFGNSMVRESKT